METENEEEISKSNGKGGAIRMKGGKNRERRGKWMMGKRGTFCNLNSQERPHLACEKKPKGGQTMYHGDI